jgi:hypothetical protein
MLSHLREVERQKQALLAPDEEVVVLEPTEEKLDYAGEESVDEKDSVQITPCDSEVEMQEAEPTIATPRRMTFHFEDDAV